MSSVSVKDLLDLASLMREQAASPLDNDLLPEYVEGVCDSMRLAASLIEAIAHKAEAGT